MKSEKPRNLSGAPRHPGYTAAIMLVAAAAAVAVNEYLVDDSTESQKPSQSASPQRAVNPPRGYRFKPLLQPYHIKDYSARTKSISTATLGAAHINGETRVREACNGVFRSFDDREGAIFDALTHVRRTLKEVTVNEDVFLKDIRESCAPYVIPVRMDEVLARAISQGDVRVAEEVKDDINAECARKSAYITVEPDVSRCETLPRESPRLTCIKQGSELLTECKTKKAAELQACIDAYDAFLAACEGKSQGLETTYICAAKARMKAEQQEKERRIEVKEECLKERVEQMKVDRSELDKNWSIAKAAKLFAAHTNIMGADHIPSIDESVDYAMLLRSLLLISDDTDVFKALAVKDRQEFVRKYIDSAIEKFAGDAKPEAKRFVQGLELVKMMLKLLRD